jgi:hypothetical protein
MVLNHITNPKSHINDTILLNSSIRVLDSVFWRMSTWNQWQRPSLSLDSHYTLHPYHLWGIILNQSYRPKPQKPETSLTPTQWLIWRQQSFREISPWNQKEDSCPHQWTLFLTYESFAKPGGTSAGRRKFREQNETS